MEWVTVASTVNCLEIIVEDEEQVPLKDINYMCTTYLVCNHDSWTLKDPSSHYGDVYISLNWTDGKNSVLTKASKHS